MVAHVVQQIVCAGRPVTPFAHCAAGYLVRLRYYLEVCGPLLPSGGGPDYG